MPSTLALLCHWITVSSIETQIIITCLIQIGFRLSHRNERNSCRRSVTSGSVSSNGGRGGGCILCCQLVSVFCQLKNLEEKKKEHKHCTLQNKENKGGNYHISPVKKPSMFFSVPNVDLILLWALSTSNFFLLILTYHTYFSIEFGKKYNFWVRKIALLKVKMVSTYVFWKYIYRYYKGLIISRGKTP